MNQREIMPIRRSLWIDAWARLVKNRLALYSFFILLVVVTMCLFAPFLSPYPYGYADWNLISSPPSLFNQHYFGTDSLGRDIFVRILYGGRLSLLVGIISTIVSVIIGVSYGAIAGYLGGRLDGIMMRAVDILYSLPFMFLVIMLMVLFGRHIILIFVAIGCVNWLDMARIVRGQTLSLKRKAFIEAAQALGTSTQRIIFHHIVPNVMGIVVVYVTLTIPQVIIIESFLSFLGLGVQEPATSWGVLVSDGARDMNLAWWALVFPALFLSVTLFCFNFLGDGLRDALDPKDR